MIQQVYLAWSLQQAVIALLVVVCFSLLHIWNRNKQKVAVRWSLKDKEWQCFFVNLGGFSLCHKLALWHHKGLISRSVCPSTNSIVHKASNRGSYILKMSIERHSASALRSFVSFCNSKQHDQRNKTLHSSTNSGGADDGCLSIWHQFALLNVASWSAEDTIVCCDCNAAWGSFSSQTADVRMPVNCPATGTLSSPSLQGHSASLFLPNDAGHRLITWIAPFWTELK